MSAQQSSERNQVFTREEVAAHNKKGDLWIIIDSNVYDLVAGQDATKIFFSLHRHEVLLKPAYARLRIGSIKDESPTIIAASPGELSAVPYAEPTWLSKGYYSPHKELQKAMRKFVDEIVYPDAQACPGKHLKGLTLMDGIVKPEEFDYFHEMIITQELVRVGARGYGDGMLGGMVIGLPPVMNFGNEQVRSKVMPEVLGGKKFICLAISEAFAGSDVSGMKTTAVKTPDGKHWIVNGTKKWITNGTFADYFTVGCRTDGGFTVILVERGPGVETSAIKTSYSPTAGTAYITFDNVKVPVENTLGPEDAGLLVILSNFNHERWVMICASARAQRLVVEECLKLAEMIARCEAIQSWLENITYQMTKMSYKTMSDKLAGQIAFAKAYSTEGAQKTAADAVQIFGGRGITKTGMGRFIEHYHRTVTFDAILGGAEDVLGDLGVRQAVKKMPPNVRL
ncbi:related to acyl-coa dehydrogenase, long-chain specific precursor [Serendipita indica DSM 11827]|uniref:Related to acyl-coa dehydrogenase, long-chain specific n=1 Tax=Serendipita indica (strain DSM 11827) TaxID=1109443 RepID=G4TF19_SERID|nr:related to acyl-coa dehydrogenase, long-chain specific precursor [Serendipita indica DSM 11827]